MVWSPGWVPSGTLVLVMPGRGTLARRNGRAGPDGVVDDDERERAFRRATTRVPRKARLAHAATVGPVGVGVAPGEPGGGAIARADHVRMGVDAWPRANPCRFSICRESFCRFGRTSPGATKGVTKGWRRWARSSPGEARRTRLPQVASARTVLGVNAGGMAVSARRDGAPVCGRRPVDRAGAVVVAAKVSVASDARLLARRKASRRDGAVGHVLPRVRLDGRGCPKWPLREPCWG